jgi:hypothetical protein
MRWYPASGPLIPGHFQALSTPDALNPVLADPKASTPMQCGDPAIAVASVAGRKRHNGFGQHILVSTHRGHIALRSKGLADDPAGATFRQVILLTDRLDRLPASIARYKFPSVISMWICFSRDRSATSLTLRNLDHQAVIS